MQWFRSLLARWRTSKKSAQDIPVPEVTHPFETELIHLLRYLKLQLHEPIWLIREEHAKKASVYYVHGLIAEVTFHPKGLNRVRHYIMVRLQSEHDGLRVWFQLVFLGYHLRFGSPRFDVVERQTHDTK